MRCHNRHRLGFILAASGLFVLALLGSLQGASWTAAGPLDSELRTLFVRPAGSGTLCTQAQPCDLQTALSQADDGDSLYLAGGTYTGSGIAVLDTEESITVYGGWDGTTDVPPVRAPHLHPTTLDGEHARLGVRLSGGAPTLDGLIVTRGQGTYSGGGIAVQNAAATIRACQILSNTAPGDGGGIFVNRGSAQLLDNLIAGNTANWSAGLRIINDADVNLVGNEIRGNVAQAWGGGVDVGCCGGSTVLIAGNRIVDNQGGQSGGGVRVEGTNARLVNNLIAGNQAVRGAGVWLGGEASYPVDASLINNTLVAGSSEGEGVWVDAHVTAALVNDLLTGHTIGITVTAPAESVLSVDHGLFWNAADPIVGTNAVRADPLLDATGHLTAGSPARDAGALVGVTTDIDGEPRPMGTGYDIGADEYPGTPPVRQFLPFIATKYGDGLGQ